nr:unnamed protein product [Spirometra erinaceieuropaei]
MDWHGFLFCSDATILRDAMSNVSKGILEFVPPLRHHYFPIGGFTEDDVGFVKDVVDIILNAESKNET